MTNPIITIAKGLDKNEVCSASGFAHQRIIDTRTLAGAARPIEECVLRRLNNHFAEYVQIPVDFGTTGPCMEVHLCETLAEGTEDTLVIADDLTQLSALLAIYKLPFTSTDFYIVETGMGEMVRTLPDAKPKPGDMHREQKAAIA
ncbi:MAG: hypothetical protein AAGJ50_12915 [Pseudomonadota bacterium]